MESQQQQMDDPQPCEPVSPQPHTSFININYFRINPPDKKGSKCGYCQKPEGNLSHCYFFADDMRLEDYQRCLDRGWTRCGTYYYKPNLEKSCCLHYQIRVDACNNS